MINMTCAAAELGVKVRYRRRRQGCHNLTAVADGILLHSLLLESGKPTQATPPSKRRLTCLYYYLLLVSQQQQLLVPRYSSINGAMA